MRTEQPQFFILPRPPASLFSDDSKKEQKFNSPVPEGSKFSVEVGEDEKIYIRYENYPFPMKGFVYPDVISALNTGKRLVRNFAMTAKRHYVLAGLFILLPNFLTKRLLATLEDEFLDNLVLPPLRSASYKIKHFCKSAAEVNRAGMIAVGESSLGKKVVEFFTYVFEFDDAWRYRKQSTFQELNKEAFRKNPYKEIRRLYQLGARRERGYYTNYVKYKAMGEGLILLMRVKPEVRKMVCKFFEELDI